MNRQAQLLFPAVQGEAVPANSRPLLEKVKSGYGFVPNLFAAFSNSPVLLEGYMALGAAFDHATLSAAERQLVMLTASVINECGYCTAAHSTVAKGMLKVSADVVASIRAGGELEDPKLAALVGLTRELIVNRGQVSDATLQAFLNAGYERAQVAEVLVGVALKTLSNYTHHLSPVDVDAPFKAEA